MKKNLRNVWISGAVCASLAVVALLAGCGKEDTVALKNPTQNESVLKAQSTFDPSIADAALNAYNNAFIVNSGGNTFYKRQLNDSKDDGTWTLAEDIQGMQDAFERSGYPAHKQLVNDLCNSFLRINPTPWAWDSWNDDIAWMSLVLVRGYQMTGTANLLTQSRYGFDLIWNRGWDTQYNGGGIWEDMNAPNRNKCALSNNPVGQLACMIYQSTGDKFYLDRAKQIYDWSWNHLFDSNSGHVYAQINQDNTIVQGNDLYNQGTFVDYANLMYKITQDANYLRDAQRATDYVKNNMTTGGVISNSAGYLTTWAAEFSRALGHLCKDNNLYGTYYDWMVQNANAIWNNRRTDLNLTWNGWNEKTPNNSTAAPTIYVSAVAWLQFVPGINPVGASLANGTYKIINRASGKALDAKGGATANGTSLIQWGYNGGNNQRWTVTNLGNGQYKIINVASGRALDISAASQDAGASALLWDYNGGLNQKVTLGSPASGYYSIFFQHNFQVLDVSGGSTADGATVLQWPYSGGNNQQWQFQAP